MVVVTNKYAMMAPLRFMPLITPLSRTLTRAPGDTKKKNKKKRELNSTSVGGHARRTPSRPLGSSLTVLLALDVPSARLRRRNPAFQASLSPALLFFESGNHVADLFRY